LGENLGALSAKNEEWCKSPEIGAFQVGGTARARPNTPELEVHPKKRIDNCSISPYTTTNYKAVRKLVEFSVYSKWFPHRMPR